MAVLKDNAYGHGLVRIAKHLHREGCRHFGVATLHEALTVQQAGINDSYILILRALTATELPVAMAHDFRIMIADLAQLRLASQIGERHSKSARVHLKIDTGLGRLGFLPDDVPALADALQNVKWVEVEGVASHFAVSASRHEFHGIQLTRFRAAVEQLQRVKPKFIRHIAASSVTTGMPEAWLDMVRISSLLYGLSNAEYVPWGLDTVLTWVAPLLQIKTVPPGWNVGYGLRYAAQDWLRIGVIGVGAGDSFPYALREKATVLVRGRRCRVLGMALDQSMIDLTNVPEAAVGDEAVIIGTSGDDYIRPEELARIAGTSYGEILSRIPPRIPRFYFERGQLSFVDTMEDGSAYREERVR